MAAQVTSRMPAQAGPLPGTPPSRLRPSVPAPVSGAALPRRDERVDGDRVAPEH
jgi:hypothetical protein